MTKVIAESGDIKILAVGSEEYHSAVHLQFDKIFENNFRINTDYGPRHTSAKNEKKSPELSLFVLNLLVLKNETLVGFHTGFEETPGVYYMQNSAVLPEHRGKSYYQLTLQAIIGHLWTEGFHEITSRHYITANPIIVAKLKAGFFIQRIESHPRFGQLVGLSLYKSERTQAIARFRSGEDRTDSPPL